jgi:hypothetical protein
MKMLNNHRRLAVLTTLLGMALLLQACSQPSPSSQPQHVRGTIQTVDGQVLAIATPAGSVRVQLVPSTGVATLVQSDRAHLTDGSFLGITSIAAPNGSQRAVEVHVFPEAMRGAGEGSRGWDWPGASGTSKMTNGTASKMTNGTVSQMTNGTVSQMTNGTVSNSKMTNGTVTAQDGGSSLTLQYKDGASSGSQTITIPPDIPVVAIEPGQSGDLQPGVHVFVLATRDSAGVLTADRVLAGKDGVVPPM